MAGVDRARLKEGQRGRGVGASNYNVWRSSDAQFGSAAFAGATGGATSFTDPGAQTLPGVHFYLVRSVNSCRWESN